MINERQSYPNYKPSGVEWLGDIPVHWDVRRLKHAVKMRVSNVDKHIKDGELPVRLCNYVDVYKNDRITENLLFMRATATPAEIERFQIKLGDVLITKDSEVWNDIGVPALVEYSARDLVCGYHLALLRPLKGVINGAYLFRSLQCSVIAHQFHVAANGVTRYGMSHHGIKSAFLPLPPLAEQTAIARYLDQADERIRRYISSRERLIELLEEYRQAVIHHAATRGLDPDVRLKPSGVEWLGDVPAHWGVAAVKRHYSIQLGKMLQNGPNVPTDIAVPYLKAQHVQWFSVRTTDVPTMWASPHEIEQFGIRAGDLLVCEGGEGGRCSLIEEVPPGYIIQNALHRVRSSGNSRNDYLQYVMSSISKTGWFDAINNKATIAHFTAEKFGSLMIPVPPIPEQVTIVAYLDKATADIDAAIDRARREIELLSEYRTRLIADVVTGKVDVRDVARLPDEVE